MSEQQPESTAETQDQQPENNDPVVLETPQFETVEKSHDLGDTETRDDTG